MSVRPSLYPITAVEPVIRALGSGDASLVERIRAAYLRVEEEAYNEDLPDEEELADDPHAHELGPATYEVDEEELRDLTKLAKSFVEGKFARGEERGEWHVPIVYLIHALGLSVAMNPSFSDWKAAGWRQYADLTSAALADGPRGLLRHLVEGRSLSGRKIRQDGSWYAWLTVDEVAELAAALRAVPEDALRASGEGWPREFHRDLLGCLAQCEGKCLFLAA